MAAQLLCHDYDRFGRAGDHVTVRPRTYANGAIHSSRGLRCCVSPRLTIRLPVWGLTGGTQALTRPRLAGLTCLARRPLPPCRLGSAACMPCLRTRSLLSPEASGPDPAETLCASARPLLLGFPFAFLHFDPEPRSQTADAWFTHIRTT